MIVIVIVIIITTIVVVVVVVVVVVSVQALTLFLKSVTFRIEGNVFDGY
jgi:hypothetical protein